MGWKMVTHAFAMVFGNFSQAIRASLIPMIAGIVLTVVVFLALGVDLATFNQMGMSMGMSGSMSADGSAGLLPAMLLLVVVYLFVFGWIAVTWHRFILLEEYPGMVPAIGGRPIMAYVGKAILLGLIMLLIAIPLFFAVGLLAAPMMMVGMGSPFIAGAIIGLLAGTVLTWFWYRFAVVLPGTAVGKPMTIGEGWRVTGPASKDILVMCLILVGINVAVTLLLLPIMSGMPIVGQIVSLAINWVTLMVGASILTTLYGHLVEGRPLVD